jgi:hypothetical protein
MCSICLEEFGPYMHRARCSFQCQHRICAGCDNKMKRNHMNLCPECRAPRKHMTLERAQPQSEPDSLDQPVSFHFYDGRMAARRHNGDWQQFHLSAENITRINPFAATSTESREERLRLLQLLARLINAGIPFESDVTVT